MESCPSEQRKRAVVEAALTAFGRSGYRKTSVSDVAAAAGISKALVFHYFGSKKELYVHLARFCGKTLAAEVRKNVQADNTDFFDRVHAAAEIKISVLREHPGLLSFLESMYRESDETVAGEIRGLILPENEHFTTANIFEGVDYSKFKDGVDPKLVLKLMLYFSEGCVNKQPRGAPIDIGAVMDEFRECAALLRSNFYREEFV